MNTTIDPLTVPYIDPSWPFQLFSECFSIPTLILFIILSYQHYKKGFNGTFQKLVYITILNDMWRYYTQMFFIRWPQMGLFGFYLSFNNTIIPNFFAYFNMAALCHQHFFVILIAVNRLHSLFDPMRFALFWDLHFFKIILFLILLPLLPGIYICFWQKVFYVQFALNTGFMGSTGANGTETMVYCILYGTFMSDIVIVILNIVSIVKLFSWQNDRKHIGGQANFKFYAYSMYIFVVGSLYNVTEFGIYMVSHGTFWSKFFTISSNVFLDVFSLSSVWIWLLMSSDARRLVFKERIKRNVVDVASISRVEKARYGEAEMNQL